MGAAIIESDSGNLVQFVLNLPLMMSSAAERKSCGCMESKVCACTCECAHVCASPHPASVLDLSVLLCVSIFCLSLGSVCVHVSSVCVCVCVLSGRRDLCHDVLLKRKHVNRRQTRAHKWKSIKPCARRVARGGKSHPYTPSPPPLNTSFTASSSSSPSAPSPLPPPPPPYSICKL